MWIYRDEKGMSAVKILRVLRVLRPLRAINRAKGLKVRLHLQWMYLLQNFRTVTVNFWMKKRAVCAHNRWGVLLFWFMGPAALCDFQTTGPFFWKIEIFGLSQSARATKPCVSYASIAIWVFYFISFHFILFRKSSKDKKHRKEYIKVHLFPLWSLRRAYM